METDFKNISGIYRADTDIINKAIADVSPDDWFRKPGDDSNHLMWLLGHLVVHRGLGIVHQQIVERSAEA